LAVGYWLLAGGWWLLAVGYWLLADKGVGEELQIPLSGGVGTRSETRASKKARYKRAVSRHAFGNARQQELVEKLVTNEQ